MYRIEVMDFKEGDIVVDVGSIACNGKNNNEYTYTYKVTNSNALSNSMDIEIYSTAYEWDKYRIGQSLGIYNANRFVKISRNRSHPLTEIFKNDV